MDKHWFTRFYQEQIDNTYVKNMMVATNCFIHWSKYRKESYSKMLIRIHRIIANGYSGITNGLVTDNIVSEFRVFGKPLLDDGLVPRADKNWFSGVENTFIIKPLIPKIPMELSHWIENKPTQYYINFPDAKHLPYYLYTLDYLMGQLKEKFTLELLAEYIHIFVIAHPFEKINFSLCMAQVNALLSLNGYKPIYHGYLDFNCMLYNYSRIKNIFINKVKGIEYIKEN